MSPRCGTTHGASDQSGFAPARAVTGISKRVAPGGHMLEQRRQQGAVDAAIAPEHEQRIREDERRRVLAELAGRTGAADEHHDDADWRTAPAPVGETPVADPRDVHLGDGTTVDDPRRWEFPDDRWERDHEQLPDGDREQRG